MIKHFTTLFILFALLLFAGCRPSSRPKDLPPLYPCTITITQEGKPLAEAVVKLVAQTDVPQKYSPVTLTETDGKAVMSTYGFPGIPAGKYKVTVIKNVEDDIVYQTDHSGEKYIVSSKNYRTVEKRFSVTKTTPHEIEITPKSKNIDVTFDVGMIIKEQI